MINHTATEQLKFFAEEMERTHALAKSDIDLWVVLRGEFVVGTFSLCAMHGWQLEERMRRPLLFVRLFNLLRDDHRLIDCDLCEAKPEEKGPPHR